MIGLIDDFQLDRSFDHSMDSFWTHDGVPGLSHFILAVCFGFAFVAARFILDRFIFRRLAVLLLSRGTTLKINRETKKKIVKCSESMWKFTYYAAVEFAVLISTCHEPWFTDIKEYFRGWPDQELKLPIKLIYMAQCGFYLYSIAALLTWETRRKDFAVMMSHHIVTVILISYSYIARFFRIGIVVLQFMMPVMCSWKLLRFLNILRESLELVCSLDCLP